MLRECRDGRGSGVATTRAAVHAAPVRLDDVTVEGFRCFGAEAATFSFRAPGVVALTGRNDMDTGAAPLPPCPLRTVSACMRRMHG